MGQKVNPIGFRTGIVYGWKSVWYASGEDVAKNLLIDYKIRTILMEEFKENESDRNRSRNKRSDKKKKDEGAAPEVGVDKDFSAAPLVPVKVNRDFPAAPSLKKKVCFTNIEIERERGENGLIKICIHMKCDRPSEVTLREGQVRPKLEKLTGSPVIFDVDINDEDCLNATFTAEKIGEKIQQRVSYKRAINEYIKRVDRKSVV